MACCMRARGNPCDYNIWAQFGNRGWSYDAVLPYFRKSEHFAPGGDESRGRGGPLHVDHMRERAELLDAFIDAAVDEGFPRNPDYNNGKQEGFGDFQVTQKNGERWSTAHGFLDPARGRSNLKIETDALCSKIILEGKRAVGIVYIQNGGLPKMVRCNREVILSAGAVKSPHLLELSGIGNPEILMAAGIPVLHELKGVGENYRDYYAPRMNWRVKLPVTLNEQTRDLSLAKEVVKYYTQRRGVLTFTAGMTYGFIKTQPESLRVRLIFSINYPPPEATRVTLWSRVISGRPLLVRNTTARSTRQPRRFRRGTLLRGEFAMTTDRTRLTGSGPRSSNGPPSAIACWSRQPSMTSRAGAEYIAAYGAAIEAKDGEIAALRAVIGAKAVAIGMIYCKTTGPTRCVIGSPR